MISKDHIVMIRCVPMTQYEETVAWVHATWAPGRLDHIVQDNVVLPKEYAHTGQIHRIAPGPVGVDAVQPFGQNHAYRQCLCVIPCAHTYYREYCQVIRACYALGAQHYCLSLGDGAYRLLNRVQMRLFMIRVTIQRVYHCFGQALRCYQHDCKAVYTEKGFWHLWQYQGLRVILFTLSCVRPIRLTDMSAKGRLTVLIARLEPILRTLNKSYASRYVLIAVNPGRNPNAALSDMYRRQLILLDHDHPVWRRIFSHVIRILSAGSSPYLLAQGQLDRRYKHVWQHEPPALHFLDAEKQKGQQQRTALGIHKKYVCFGIREAAYYHHLQSQDAKDQFQYQRPLHETFIRNPDMTQYLPMAEFLANNHFSVVRMGEKIDRALPDHLPKDVIDYAAHHRSPWMDVYLLAHCEFAVAGCAGFFLLATAFNRPVVVCDQGNLRFRPIREGDLFIPKRMWHTHEKRFLSFQEMLDSEIQYTFQDSAHKYGVELVHNSADEILDVVQEQTERLSGSWQSHDEDEILQQRFSALYRPAYVGYEMPGRLGTTFLRQNQGLLDATKSGPVYFNA